MSKILTSPVAKFPGTITIPDYLTYPQAIAYWKGNEAARAIPDTGSMVEVNYALLPGLFLCVEKWDIQGLPEPLTVDNFPATPPRACRQLIQWVHKSITELIKDVEEIPNA